MLNGDNFAKDYKKDSYTKKNYHWKKDRWYEHVNHTEKTLILKKMWNSKILQVQWMFQHYFKISKLQKSFTMYKFVIMYMIYCYKL